MRELLIKGLKSCIDDLQNDKGDKEKNYEDLMKILNILYKNRSLYEDNPYLSKSIPNMYLICHIVKFLEENKCKQVIEIGSGTGLWASLIQILCKRRENGIIFFPTEYKIFSKGTYRFKVEYTKLEDISADNAIEKYKSCDCLFLCWSPHQRMVDEGQYSAGEMLQKFKGNYLISIGENARRSGSGDVLFYDELEKNWIEIEEKKIITYIPAGFTVIYDCFGFFYRKPPPPMFNVDIIRDMLFIAGSTTHVSQHTESTTPIAHNTDYIDHSTTPGINKERYIYN